MQLVCELRSKHNPDSVFSNFCLSLNGNTDKPERSVMLVSVCTAAAVQSILKDHGNSLVLILLIQCGAFLIVSSQSNAALSACHSFTNSVLAYIFQQFFSLLIFHICMGGVLMVIQTCPARKTSLHKRRTNLHYTFKIVSDDVFWSFRVISRVFQYHIIKLLFRENLLDYVRFFLRNMLTW